MAQRPEGLSRFGDRLVLALCLVVSLWMMTWDESTRVVRATAWAHRLTTPFEKAMVLIEDLRELKRENERLRARLTALQMDSAQLEAERARIEELAARAGFYERHRGRIVPASVIELFVSRIPVQAKIVAHGGDSLRAWLPVVNEEGLVGRIREVLGPHEALVQLLTEEDSRISVEVVPNGVSGLLRYDGRHFLLDHVPQGEPVAVGDRVISSGLGGTVPRGIDVGHVHSVRSSSTELFQQIEVEPNVRFSALRQVYVVTDPGPWYAFTADLAGAADSTAVEGEVESAPEAPAPSGRSGEGGDPGAGTGPEEAR